MSQVRMCDNCGDIFPEGAEGSAVGTVQVMVKGPDNRTRPEQRVQDSCPKCVQGADKRRQGVSYLRPVPAIEGEVSEETNSGAVRDFN